MVIIKSGIMYYRNIYDLISREGIEVEAGSLWKFYPKDNEMILVDEDQMATTPMVKSKFKKAGF